MTWIATPRSDGLPLGSVGSIPIEPHEGAVVGIGILVVFWLGLVIYTRHAERPNSTRPEPRQEEESISDREHVRELLEANGGRMHQSDIVDSVDWSKAKVSRLLSELEDDGEISKLRLGRENLVCLPGHEPSATKSPEHARTD